MLQLPKQHVLVEFLVEKEAFIIIQDIEILGWSPAGSVLPHGEKVSLKLWLATLLVMVP